MMLKLSPLAILLAAALALPACADSPDAKTEAPAATSAPKAKAKKAAAAPAETKPAAPADAAAPAAPADELVVLETSAGEVVIDLYEDKTPGHAENMKKLVRQGYYDGSPFHRVIAGFMAQGGGQWAGSQPGDVGYTQPAEIVPGLLHVRGSVAAARTGDGVNPERRSSGSQFYICFVPTPFLDASYTVFGEVVSGMDNVDKLTKGAPGSGSVAPEQASKILRAWLKPNGAAAVTTK